MAIISSRITDEIGLKLKEIASRPSYYDRRRELVVHETRSLGDLYSFWIENPDLRKRMLLDRKQPKTILREAREGIHHINNAWYYLSTIGRYGTFMDYLNPSVLKKTNDLVSPIKLNGKYMPREYRAGNVTLGFQDYLPPSPEKIPSRIQELLARVRQAYPANPLEAAITAHLGIAAIQPFDEGNKRTARLIQNRILMDTNMPPVVIPAGEAVFYFNLLEKALSESDSSPEKSRPFYDYCASKVNDGLDEILDDLNVVKA